MHMIPCGLAAFVVASIYYTWRAYHGALLHRERTLRERVAYLLWCVADGTD
jgi:hypothetical protein